MERPSQESERNIHIYMYTYEYIYYIELFIHKYVLPSFLKMHLHIFLADGLWHKQQGI